MTPSRSNDEMRELAEAYALGELSEAERARFDERLARGDAQGAEAWAAFKAVSERVYADIQEVQPSPGVRAALEARLGGTRSAPSFATVDQGDDPIASDPLRRVIMREHEIDWADSGVPGVRMRNLFVDREHNRLTLLIQMDPGAVFPDHEHPGVEECLVLEGDLHIAGTVLGKMDYLRTPAGGRHGEPRTENGCLLLVTCPLEPAA